MLDFVFFTDASPDTGFGHVARCLHLARLLHAHRPETRIGFQGAFTDGARQHIAASPSRIDVFPPNAETTAHVGIVDRMNNTEDAEDWDLALAESVAARCSRAIHIASGVTLPALPDGFVCVGYQPGGPPPCPPRLYWGLEFAPVPSDLLDAGVGPRDPATVLVAFGGSRDVRIDALAAAALERLDWVRRIEVLASPVNPSRKLPLRPSAHRQLTMHEDLSSVAALLGRAGVVLTSFGNLGYEALAFGAPLCLLGRKCFQVDLAKTFESLGLAVSAGHMEASSTAALAQAIDRTRREAAALSGRARRLIDGRGLDRIAQLILGRPLYR